MLIAVRRSTVILLLAFCSTWHACSHQEDLFAAAPASDEGDGITLFLRGDYGGAIEALHRSIEVDGPRREPFRYLARCYLALGKSTEAEKAVKRAIAIGPADAALLNIEGAVYLARAFAQAQYTATDSAQAAFSAAIALDSTHAQSHYNLGLVYAYRDSTERARDSYRRAVRIDPSLAQAHKKLGLSFREEGLVDSAFVHFRAAIATTPDDAEALFHLGFLHRISGHYDKALEALERASELNPLSPQVQFNLASVLMRLGRREEAQGALKRSEILRRSERGIDSQVWMPSGGVMIGPATARYNIALNHALRGDHEQAILEYRNTIEIDPSAWGLYTKVTRFPLT